MGKTDNMERENVICALTKILEGGYTLRAMDYITEDHVDKIQRMALFVVDQLRRADSEV